MAPGPWQQHQSNCIYNPGAVALPGKCQWYCKIFDGVVVMYIREARCILPYMVNALSCYLQGDLVMR